MGAERTSRRNEGLRYSDFSSWLLIRVDPWLEYSKNDNNRGYLERSYEAAIFFFSPTHDDLGWVLSSCPHRGLLLQALNNLKEWNMAR